MAQYKTLRMHSEAWTTKFHASTGRTYKLNLMGIVRTTNGLSERPTYPVALVEDKTGNIKAVYPDPRFKDVFTCLDDAAQHYDSAIESYESVEDMAS